MRALRLASLVVLLTCAGCQLGSRIENLEPALGPHGASVRLAIGAVPVELLTVSDTALLVRRPTGAIVLALYRNLSSVSFEHLGTEYSLLGRARTPDPALRERWRLVARYPQGLRPDQLAQLLQAARQRALEVL
jgi:hypothetical protein